MRLVHVLLGAGVFSTLAGCAMAAPPGDKKSETAFAYAFAMRGCTQEDAPALEIYFTQTPYAGTGDPSPPYIRFEISSSQSEAIAPASLTLTGLRRDLQKTGRIVRAQLVELGHDPIWLSGTIALTKAAQGQRVLGHYDVATPAGRRLDRSFVAEYSKRTAVCG